MARERHANQSYNVDREIDLKGEVCPYTFVKSKLEIEDMNQGEILKIVVDHLPAVDNVPRSLENEGNEIIEIKKLNETDWHIVTRKG